MDREIASMNDLLVRIIYDENEEPAKLPMWFLESITDNFSGDNKIGSGGFADVYRGLLRNGMVVAVKKLRHSEMVEMQGDKFEQEIRSLMKVNHKNVVRCLGYCSESHGNMLMHEGKNIMAEERQRFLCFEFMPGSLDNYIRGTSQRLEWRTWYQIIKGICEGLHYLHIQQRIVHSDLKPANILLDHGMMPKIADFGLAKCFDEGQTRVITRNLVGSLGYMAPEYQDGLITFKSDIYSLGITIIEILAGQKIYGRQINEVLEICKARFQTLQLEEVKVCTEIGFECMDLDQAKRPTTQHIIDRLHELDGTMAPRVVMDSLMEVHKGAARLQEMLQGSLTSLVVATIDEIMSSLSSAMSALDSTSAGDGQGQSRRKRGGAAADGSGPLQRSSTRRRYSYA